MTKPTLVLLAAGLGSRYGGLKQIAGLGPNGEVLMEYSIHDAINAGFGKVVFIIRHDIEDDFRQIVASKLPESIPVEFVFQELDSLPESYFPPKDRIKPWGTAHALWCAREKVKENFAVLNADDFYGRSGFENLVHFFNTTTEIQEDGALIGYRLDKTLSESGPVSRGLCRQDQNGSLTYIEEVNGLKQDGASVTSDYRENGLTLTGNELVSMNFWGFKPAIFTHLDHELQIWISQNSTQLKAEFLLPSVIGTIVKAGHLRIKVLNSDSEWMGVTYTADNEPVKNKLNRMVNQADYPSPLW